MAKAVKEKDPPVRWFKTKKKLGEVRCLPTDIDPRVVIRKPKNGRRCGGYGNCHEFSIVCLPNPRSRTINCNYASVVVEDINTPKLILQYDLNTLDRKTNENIGYLYRVKDDTKSLKEILADPIAFHFTNVYDPSAYMCLTNRYHSSPKVLNNVFWDSSFSGNWDAHYGRGSNELSKAAFERYIAFVKKGRDRQHKQVLANYTDYFETDKKPHGIFITKDKSVIAKVGGEQHLFPGKKYMVGFAWFAKNRWWIYFKNNTFLRLTPEQVSAM